MIVGVQVAADLERQSLPDRLRWWAGVHGRAASPNLALIATLEDAATEIELGERSGLTYRGDDALPQ